jgi:hypothetical protein
VKTFTVHAPPDDPGAADRFAFVKDGFSWPALFFPVLWILWHRLWLTLVGYVIFVLVVAWTGRVLGEDAATAIAILGGLLFAFEANNIRRASLAQRGWTEAGGSAGNTLEEAEMRFFAARGTGEVPAERAAPARAAFTPEARPGADDPILGLFPEPER